jgi:hypothetical protein
MSDQLAAKGCLHALIEVSRNASTSLLTNDDNNNNNNNSNKNNNNDNNSSGEQAARSGSDDEEGGTAMRPVSSSASGSGKRRAKRRGTVPVDEHKARPLRVHLFTAHLQSSYFPALGHSSDHFVETQAVRLRQLTEVRQFMERCMADDWHDAMLVGDFNINARPPTHGDAESERRDAGDPLAPLVDPDAPFTVSQPYADMLATISSPHWRIYDPLRAAAEAAGMNSHPITSTHNSQPTLLYQ